MELAELIDDWPVQVLHSEERGRYLVASRALRRGEKVRISRNALLSRCRSSKTSRMHLRWTSCTKQSAATTAWFAQHLKICLACSRAPVTRCGSAAASVEHEHIQAYDTAHSNVEYSQRCASSRFDSFCFSTYAGTASTSRDERTHNSSTGCKDAVPRSQHCTSDAARCKP